MQLWQDAELRSGHAVQCMQQGTAEGEDRKAQQAEQKGKQTIKQAFAAATAKKQEEE